MTAPAHPRAGPGGRLRRLLLLGALALLPAARAAGPDEAEVRAVFLFNFAQFVDWPEAAFASPGSPLVIGILGDDPFGAVLDEVVRGERVRLRPLVVRRYARIDEVRDCHILFVARSSSGRLEDVLARLRGRPVLTVGETEGFAARGGMIRFVTEQRRTRLRINLTATEAAGLTLSSKLLRPAEIVGAGPPPP